MKYLGGAAILAHLAVPALAADLPSRPIQKALPVAAAGTGGFAYGRVTSSLNFTAPTVPILVTSSTSETRVGWAAGVVHPNGHAALDGDVVRGTLSYRFNSGSVVDRY